MFTLFFFSTIFREFADRERNVFGQYFVKTQKQCAILYSQMIQQQQQQQQQLPLSTPIKSVAEDNNIQNNNISNRNDGSNDADSASQEVIKTYKEPAVVVQASNSSDPNTVEESKMKEPLVQQIREQLSIVNNKSKQSQKRGSSIQEAATPKVLSSTYKRLSIFQFDEMEEEHEHEHDDGVASGDDDDDNGGGGGGGGGYDSLEQPEEHQNHHFQLVETNDITSSGGDHHPSSDEHSGDDSISKMNRVPPARNPPPPPVPSPNLTVQLSISSSCC